MKRWVDEAIQAFQVRLGKQEIPVAIVQPLVRTINEVDLEERDEITDVDDSDLEALDFDYQQALEEIRRVSRPLEIPFDSDEEEDWETTLAEIPEISSDSDVELQVSSDSDEEEGWETSLPPIDDLLELQRTTSPEYIHSSPRDSDTEFEYELWRWQIS